MSSTNLSGPLLRRHIGRRLEQLRKKAGLSQTMAAQRVQLGRSTLIRMEDGDPGVKLRDVDLEALLKLYGADEKTKTWLLACAAGTRNGNSNGWWHDYTQPELPDWFSLFVVLEDSAEIIREYEPELVPGLLQTREYAAEVVRTPAGYLDEDEMERRVQIRIERQGLLTRPRAPHFEAVLNESVIRRPVGGPDVMSRQLAYLLQATERIGITVRILPYAAGVHGGMAASAFTLLKFPDGPPPESDPIEPPLAYVDTLTGAMYLQKTEEVEAYELVWRDLDQKALSAAKSRELIVSVMEGNTR